MGPARAAEPELSKALEIKSLFLEKLSVAFMADAQQFFQARNPIHTWRNLQSLVLTSRLLTHTADREEICDMLQAAGEAALRMPKLQIMALWNCGHTEACVFVYRKEFDDTSITWRGTWDMELEPRVITAWERVALENTRHELRCGKRLLPGESITSHGEAIHQLDLPPEVLDPVSLRQIRREAAIDVNAA